MAYFGEHGLSATGRSVEEDSFRRSEQPSSRVEELGIAQREDDGLPKLGNNRIQSTDI